MTEPASSEETRRREGGREEWLAATLVELADTLITDFDVVDFLSMLAERIVELLDATEVGLVLADAQGHLRVMASSTERMRLLDLFEVQTDEGPCADCYRSGRAIVNVDLDGAMARWPVFAPMARAAGFRAVHALPLRLRDEVIGAANIFHAEMATINERDTHLAQALADVATIGLLHERALRHATDLSAQLQRALNSRVSIEQAKGAVAERAGVDMDTAFAWLRTYARSHRLRLADVSVAIVERALPVEALTATSNLPPERR
jgi:transcriptional regulator with GAF, ATPase, and Fis domain